MSAAHVVGVIDAQVADCRSTGHTGNVEALLEARAVVQALGTAQEDLAAAGKAWRSKNHCEAQLARLRGYRYLTPAMKSDRNSFATELGVAQATLARILGGAR